MTERRSFQRRLSALVENDLFYSFRKSRLTVVATILLILIVMPTILADWVAPHNPYNLSTLNLEKSELPPAWMKGGERSYLLGTDNQGRDLLSAMLYGSRVSLMIGFVSVIIAMLLGVSFGLIGGYFGGIMDSILMRIADVMLSFPSIMVALLINGIAKAFLPRSAHEGAVLYILILSIAFTSWVYYARTVRAETMVEKNKDYVLAARVIGLRPAVILFRHILPNVLNPVLVIATLNLGTAIMIEATLSFLGVGMPPTKPSLGTLVRIGNDYLFSGIWWVVTFPAIFLSVVVVSVNLLGDWLRDALNPKLR